MPSAPASPGFAAHMACRNAPYTCAAQQNWGSGMFASSPLEVSTEEASYNDAAAVAAASMLCCSTCCQRQMESKLLAAAALSTSLNLFKTVC